jgi:hypothetical protein
VAPLRGLEPQRAELRGRQSSTPTALAHTNEVGAAGGDACMNERVSCPDPPAIGPGTRSVAIGFGGNRRGGIGTEQQRVELGFERGYVAVTWIQ